jgi:hypothetical protein
MLSREIFEMEKARLVANGSQKISRQIPQKLAADKKFKFQKIGSARIQERSKTRSTEVLAIKDEIRLGQVS